MNVAVKTLASLALLVYEKSQPTFGLQEDSMKLFRALYFILLMVLAAPFSSAQADIMEDMLYENLNPKIEFFRPNQFSVAVGEPVLLSWSVQFARNIELQNETTGDKYQNLPESGSIQLFPNQTSVISLVASSQSGQTHTHTLQIQVVASPLKIVRFSASQTSIDSIQPVRLSWLVENAVNVDIYDSFRNQSYVNLGNQNYIEVWPERSAYYLLTATDAYGKKETARLEITFIDRRPKILAFQASSLQVAPGQMVSLSWTSANAQSVELIVNDGRSEQRYSELPAKGRLELPIDRESRCQLLVKNERGEVVSQSLVIRILQPQSEINFFYSSQVNISVGQTIDLRWQVSGVERIEILRNGVPINFGILPLQGQIQDRPTTDTSYQLVAYRSDQSRLESAPINIRVFP